MLVPKFQTYIALLQALLGDIFQMMGSGQNVHGLPPTDGVIHTSVR